MIVLIVVNLYFALQFMLDGGLGNLGYGMVRAPIISESGDPAQILEHIQKVRLESGRSRIWASGLLVLNAIAALALLPKKRERAP